jgi:hypothetical protein
MWGWLYKVFNCKKCKSSEVQNSFFSDVVNARSKVVRIPTPSQEKMELASTFLGPNPVGIFARGRKRYGRNLQPEFYIKLIELL